jgi:AcrR family transcriptional regulator
VSASGRYHRYDSKEDLLRTLCRQGQDIYIAEIEQALASEAEQMQTMTVELFERVRASGALRPDITYLDIEDLLEFLSTVKLGNAEHAAELRQRHLTVIIDGLHNDHPTPLPGDPTWRSSSNDGGAIHTRPASRFTRHALVLGFNLDSSHVST